MISFSHSYSTNKQSPCWFRQIIFYYCCIGCVNICNMFLPEKCGDITSSFTFVVLSFLCFKLSRCQTKVDDTVWVWKLNLSVFTSLSVKHCALRHRKASYSCCQHGLIWFLINVISLWGVAHWPGLKKWCGCLIRAEKMRAIPKTVSQMRSSVKLLNDKVGLLIRRGFFDATSCSHMLGCPWVRHWTSNCSS